MLSELLDGVYAIANEWTESPLYHTWYREQGRWCAQIHGTVDKYTPIWQIHVWLKDKGHNVRGNRLAVENVECRCYVDSPQAVFDRETAKGLERARNFADAILERRQPSPAAARGLIQG